MIAYVRCLVFLVAEVLPLQVCLINVSVRLVKLLSGITRVFPSSALG